MIRFLDAAILAHTKLRTHRVRTGISVGVAGILFGLMLAVIMVSQGVFESVERFSKEGLGDRMIMTVSQFSSTMASPYDYADDAAFIAEVEQHHAEYVAKKKTLAVKYQIDYNPKTEDPSPVEVHRDTGKKHIIESMISDQHVMAVSQKRSSAQEKPFDINQYLAAYPSAKVLPDNSPVQPRDGALQYMQKGKESALLPENERSTSARDEPPSLSVTNETITRPFIATTFDASRGEVPVVVPFSHAEKMLGLKPLPKDSVRQDKLKRLQEVRERVGEVTASFCYRNAASQRTLEQAVAQQKEIAANKNNREYQAPPLQYAVPASDSCGAVVTTKDTRTTREKEQAERQTAYEKELGVYSGDPVQHKVTVRAVGISGDVTDSMASTVGDMVASMLGSWLGYNVWTVPADLLRQLPDESRPEVLFSSGSAHAGVPVSEHAQVDTYFVEFTNKDEARQVLKRNSQDMAGERSVYVSPYGSATLVVDELRMGLEKVLLWALAVIGGIALIILASIIGRTVAEGRRESAVFRAIGARRVDVGSIYGTYALLLSLRVVIFAVVLGAAMALVVEVLYQADATMGARLAYAAIDVTKEFHLFSIWSWYIPVIMVAIVAVGLLASVIPILLGARRNPIRDMRNE